MLIKWTIKNKYTQFSAIWSSSQKWSTLDDKISYKTWIDMQARCFDCIMFAHMKELHHNSFPKS
jgi:hypothetical protein